MDSIRRLKKKANDKVDITQERALDPKYKTELCRKYEESKFCPYGSKCRFAHGKEELFARNEINYKKKDCKSFHSEYFCAYGSRCLFKHGYSISEIQRSFYNSLLSVLKGAFLQNQDLPSLISRQSSRLEVFHQICNSNPATQATINHDFNYCMKMSGNHPIVLPQDFYSIVNLKKKGCVNEYKLSLSTNNCTPVSSSPHKEFEGYSLDSRT